MCGHSRSRRYSYGYGDNHSYNSCHRRRHHQGPLHHLITYAIMSAKPLLSKSASSPQQVQGPVTYGATQIPAPYTAPALVPQVSGRTVQGQYHPQEKHLAVPHSGLRAPPAAEDKIDAPPAYQATMDSSAAPQYDGEKHAMQTDQDVSLLEGDMGSMDINQREQRQVMGERAVAGPSRETSLVMSKYEARLLRKEEKFAAKLARKAEKNTRKEERRGI